MKQGTGRNVTTGQKATPNTYAVSVDKTANIGIQIVRTSPSTKELYKGRGFQSPPMKAREYNKGSQGKY
jgi:hypothetical protein